MSCKTDLTVDEALRAAHEAGLERVEAHWLLGGLLERPRAWLLAHGDSPLAPPASAAWHQLLARYQDGEPLAYLLGWAEFRGLTLKVSPAVLVPRSDTEVLVNWALDLLGAHAFGKPTPKVLDLGTGSGAVALAVKRAWPTAAVTATDASPAALAVAADNGRSLGLDVSWRQGDWWAAVPAGAMFDLVLSNPPYIADQDQHLAALRHEPRSALTAGHDGLDDLRRIIARAPVNLSPGAWLLLEHGWTQSTAVAGLFVECGFTDVQTRTDLAGRPRCTGGRWPELAGTGTPHLPTHLGHTG